MRSVWDIPNMLDFAKAEWAKGTGANIISGMIAKKFFADLNRTRFDAPTRNAIIGKMGREGVESPKSFRCNRDAQARAARKRKTQPPAPPRTVTQIAKRDYAPARAPTAIEPDGFVPTPGFISPEANRLYKFSDLDVPRKRLNEQEKIRHCRWIEGDPKGLFQAGNTTAFLCGCEAEKDLPYCKEHNHASLPKHPITAKSKQLNEVSREKELA